MTLAEPLKLTGTPTYTVEGVPVALTTGAARWYSYAPTSRAPSTIRGLPARSV
jgi:hypothetical protein